MATAYELTLLGKPAFGNDFDLDGALEVCKKATSQGSKIDFGKCIVEDESTGIWSQATAGSKGRMGWVPALAPVMTDSSPTFYGVTRAGAEGYVKAGGAIKVGARCSPDSNGDFIQFVPSDVTATPTESTIEAAINDYQEAPFVFLGHYGEGSGLDTGGTPAAQNDIIRVRKL
jgi:hypothetical protein